MNSPKVVKSGDPKQVRISFVAPITIHTKRTKPVMCHIWWTNPSTLCDTRSACELILLGQERTLLPATELGYVNRSSGTVWLCWQSRLIGRASSIYDIINVGWMDGPAAYMISSMCSRLNGWASSMYDIMGAWMGGSRIRYSIKNCVLIRDSISEISP